MMTTACYAGMDYEDQSTRLDGFAKTIRETPGVTACLVGFFLPRDARQRVQIFLQQQRDYLVSRVASKHRASRLSLDERSGFGRWICEWFIRGLAAK
jgi:hypothetical protein